MKKENFKIEVIVEPQELLKEDINEKIKALIEFLFRRELKYKIQDKKVILNVDKGFKNFAELFKDKFKEILDLELEVHELESPNTEKEDK